MDEQQVPNPSGASVGAPQIITQLNDNTGPQANASEFGYDIGGLANGLAGAASNITDIGKLHQHAKDSLWALQQSAQANKDWSQKLSDAQVAGQPLDPNKFDTDFQNDIAKRVQGAPTEQAGIMFQHNAINMSTDFFHQNLNATAQYNIEKNKNDFQSLVSDTMADVQSGKISADEGKQRINNFNRAAGAAVPGSNQIVAQSHADIDQANIVNFAQKQGPDVAAAAIRSGAIATQMDPVTREMNAITLDNKAANDIKARQQMAQSNVTTLQNQIASGQNVNPVQLKNATTELQQANAAAPIPSTAPAMVDVITQQRNATKQAVEALPPNDYNQMKLGVDQEFDNQKINNYISQKFSTLTPSQQQIQKDQLASSLGNQDPATKFAASFIDKNKPLVTPGDEKFNPVQFTYLQKDIQDSYTAAQQYAQANNGQGGQPAQLYLQKSVAAQLAAGVPVQDVRTLEKSDAEQRALNFNDPQQFQQQVKQLQDFYGNNPVTIQGHTLNFGNMAIQEAAQAGNKKGTLSPAMGLALMNYQSQSVIASAGFKGGVPDADKKAIQAQVQSELTSSSSPLYQYQQAFSHKPSSADEISSFTEGVVPMAEAYKLQHGGSIESAVSAVFQDTIGHANQFVSNTSGMKTAIPSEIAPYPADAQNLIDKANAMIPFLSDNLPAQGGLGRPGAAIYQTAAANGGWKYEKSTDTLRLYQPGVDGMPVPVVSQATGQPIELDAKKLMSANFVDHSNSMGLPDSQISEGYKAELPKKLDGNLNDYIVQPTPPQQQGPALKESTNSTSPENGSGNFADFTYNAEVRRDANGNASVYNLPANDGGGNQEIAGFNDKYDPNEFAQLKAAAPQDREEMAKGFLNQKTQVAASWSQSPPVQGLLRDIVFNRGSGGAQQIIKMAVGSEANPGKISNSVNQGDLNQLNSMPTQDALNALTKARMEYEHSAVGVRPNLEKGLMNRFNNARQYFSSMPSGAGGNA